MSFLAASKENIGPAGIPHPQPPGVPEHAGPNGGHAEPPRKSRGSRGGARRKRNLCNAYPHWTMQGKLERLETREVMLQAQ